MCPAADLAGSSMLLLKTPLGGHMFSGTDVCQLWNRCKFVIHVHGSSPVRGSSVWDYPEQPAANENNMKSVPYSSLDFVSQWIVHIVMCVIMFSVFVV